MSTKKNTLWLGGQFLSASLLAFIAIKINILNYGDTLLGSWLILSSVWSLSLGIDFGFGVTIIRFISAARSENPEFNVEDIYSFSVVAIVVLGILLGAVSYSIGYAFYLSNPGIVPPAQYSGLRLSFDLLALNFLVQYFAIAFRSTLEGHGHFIVTSKMLITFNVLVFLFTVAVYLFKLPVYYLSAAFLSSSLIYLSLTLIAKRKLLHGLHFSFRKINTRSLRAYFGFGFNMQAASVFIAVLDPAIKYIFGSLISLSTVTNYEIARRISIALSGLYQNSFRHLITKTSSLANDEEKLSFLKGDALTFSKIGVLYSNIVYGAGSIFLYLLIILAFREPFIFYLLAILLAGDAFQPLVYTGYSFLLGTAKTFVILMVHFIQLIMITGIVFLSAYFFSDPAGLAVYPLAIIVSMQIIYHYVLEGKGIHINKYYADSSFHKFLPTFAGMLLSLFFYKYFPGLLSYYLSVFCLVTLGLNFKLLKIYYRAFLPSKNNLAG